MNSQTTLEVLKLPFEPKTNLLKVSKWNINDINSYPSISMCKHVKVYQMVIPIA
jgi:hypothetical protein